MPTPLGQGWEKFHRLVSLVLSVNPSATMIYMPGSLCVVGHPYIAIQAHAACWGNDNESRA
jgi:hypothetical protein